MHLSASSWCCKLVLSIGILGGAPCDHLQPWPDAPCPVHGSAKQINVGRGAQRYMT